MCGCRMFECNCSWENSWERERNYRASRVKQAEEKRNKDKRKEEE